MNRRREKERGYGISRHCDRNRRRRLRWKPRLTAGMILDLAEAATSSTWQPSCISQQTCAISCVASLTVVRCHRSRQSLLILLRDTLRRVWSSLALCHWNTAHLSHTSKSVVFRHIAKAKCKEAHYCVNGKFYFAVTFENVSGGCELRNRYFKGCRGDARTSHICRGRDGPSTECAVFEGSLIISPHSHSV